MAEDNKKEYIKEEYRDGLHIIEYLSEPENPELENELPKKDIRKKTERQKAWLVLCLSLVLILIIGTFAWYVILAIRQVDSKDTTVMTPYMLYLLDPADESSLALTIGNLHPGETKQAVICVSSQKPEEMGIATISKDSEFAYELELAYTQNLALDYKVYELELIEDAEANSTEGLIVVEDSTGSNTKTFKRALSGEKLAKADPDVSQERQKEMYGGSNQNLDSEWPNIASQIVNLGQYDSYKKDASNNDLSLNTKITEAGGTVEYDKDYYLIEMTWKENDQQGKPIRFDDYTKETDLIYIIVKAMQPKPVEEP